MPLTEEQREAFRANPATLQNTWWLLYRPQAHWAGPVIVRYAEPAQSAENRALVVAYDDDHPLWVDVRVMLAHRFSCFEFLGDDRELTWIRDGLCQWSGAIHVVERVSPRPGFRITETLRQGVVLTRLGSPGPVRGTTVGVRHCGVLLDQWGLPQEQPEGFVPWQAFFSDFEAVRVDRTEELAPINLNSLIPLSSLSLTFSAEAEDGHEVSGNGYAREVVWRDTIPAPPPEHKPEPAPTVWEHLSADPFIPTKDDT